MPYYAALADDPAAIIQLKTSYNPQSEEIVSYCEITNTFQRCWTKVQAWQMSFD